MKTKIKIALVASIFLLLMSCKGSENDFPTGTDKGLESISGIVTNERGEKLEGIRIEAYYDERLTEHYPNNDWYLLSDEDKELLAYKDPTIYTDTDGAYTIAEPAHEGIDSLNVYVVATDTSNIYQSQTQKGLIKYIKVTLPDNVLPNAAGEAHVNFVLKKKI